MHEKKWVIKELGQNEREAIIMLRIFLNGYWFQLLRHIPIKFCLTVITKIITTCSTSPIGASKIPGKLENKIL